MKKLIAPIAALALALPLQFALPTAAQAQLWTGPTPELVELCKALSDESGLFNSGQCIAFYRSNPEAFPGTYCALLNNAGILDSIDLTVGECVALLKEWGY